MPRRKISVCFVATLDHGPLLDSLHCYRQIHGHVHAYPDFALLPSEIVFSVQQNGTHRFTSIVVTPAQHRSVEPFMFAASPAA